MSWIFQGIVVYIVATLVMSTVGGYVEVKAIPASTTLTTQETTTVADTGGGLLPAYDTEVEREEYCQDNVNTGLSGWYTADARPVGSWSGADTSATDDGFQSPAIALNTLCTARFTLGQVGDTIVILIPLALVFLIMGAVGLGTSVNNYGRIYKGFKSGREGT